jgi:hypothetical protein
MEKLRFLRVYFSPFKAFWPSLYIGKIAVGTPYFYPRRWVKNPKKTGYLMAVPRRVGFDFVSLGYKTKWDELDYRFEWNPIWSFVFFGLQVALIFRPRDEDHYWTCWLIYDYHTDKSKSRVERILEAREKFPCIWTRYSGDDEQTVCYWDFILKNKYK